MTGKKRKPPGARRHAEKGAGRKAGHHASHHDERRERPGAKPDFKKGPKPGATAGYTSYKPEQNRPEKVGRASVRPQPVRSQQIKSQPVRPQPVRSEASKPEWVRPASPKPVRAERPQRRELQVEGVSPGDVDRGGAGRGTSASGGRGAPFWLYGLHAARAALANTNRKIRKAVLTARAASELGPTLLKGIAVEPAEAESVARLLPQGAVHQGIALLCEPLPDTDLSVLLGSIEGARKLVAVLDQVTDPHNEGAILRSAAAFGVAAVIVQDRHSPPESGALAKAASGALDLVPRITVVNIARALDELGEMGFWRIALAADGDMALREAGASGNIAVVLGAEGTGIRRLVRERCDATAFVPMTGPIDSLNVSNAAAIAFYELSQGEKP